MKKANPSKVMIFKLVPALLVVGFGAYAVIELLISGILPPLYAIGLSVMYVLIAAAALLLTLRPFMTKGRAVTARVFGVIILALILAVSFFGVYTLKRSLSVLDSVSDSENAVTIETREGFNVFISGIDTYGDIQTQSRSDVNIVASVNPDTRKVLLTTIPRDSYVSIALGGNDGMDKLTHAGNYGIESSMKTVARLLDTDIDAYLRINFTSFIKSIDTIGGITVSNPRAFTIDGVTFPAGQVELDGKRALLFSRERKSLEGGDVDRGKNQQRVIEGVINKMSRVRSISDFEALLSMVGTSVQTNISTGTAKSLINQQIGSPKAWTTTSYSLEGKGQTGGLPSYAMPNAQLYMYVLDKQSVQKAQQSIRDTLGHAAQ